MKELIEKTLKDLDELLEKLKVDKKFWYFSVRSTVNKLKVKLKKLIDELNNAE